MGASPSDGSGKLMKTWEMEVSGIKRLGAHGIPDVGGRWSDMVMDMVIFHGFSWDLMGYTLWKTNITMEDHRKIIGKPKENHRTMVVSWGVMVIYPLVNISITTS